MDDNKLLNHLFEISYKLDQYSASKNYKALRKLHYDNIQWIEENGLVEEYYNYWFGGLQKEGSEIDKN